MAGVQGSPLTVAVSEAGGLGSLPCGMLTVEQIVSEIQAIKAATDKPYNLNFFCHEASPYSASRQATWRSALHSYFDELDLDQDNISGNANRVPFSHETADAIEPFSPGFISFHFGLPAPDLLKRVQSWGTTVVSSATTVDEAVWLASYGIDGIIAQVGTTYLLCPEATTSALHKGALKQERSAHTAVTNVFSGKPARGIVNRAMRELGYMKPAVAEFPYASIEMTALRQEAERHGRDDFSPLWCGQNTLGCKEISAGELTQELSKGAAKAVI